jgi:drug/metabolite transporter (DMT)-like permease
LTYTPHQQRQAELGLLLTTVIWGSTFILIRNILPSVGPFTLLALRFVIGFAALFLLFMGRMRRITRRDVKAGVILGLLFFAGNALQTSGLQYTSAGVSGFITALSVVMVPPFALLVLRQRSTRGAVVGVVLATIGLALLSLNDNLSLGYGDLLTLGCAVVFAFHIVYTAKYAMQTEPTVMVAVQLALSSLAAIVFAGATETIGPISQDVLLAAIYLGLFPTAVCFVMQVYAQRRTSAARTALIFTMEPVFAALFAFLVAGEMISPRGLVGCVFILGAMLAAELG